MSGYQSRPTPIRSAEESTAAKFGYVSLEKPPTPRRGRPAVMCLTALIAALDRD